MFFFSTRNYKMLRNKGIFQWNLLQKRSFGIATLLVINWEPQTRCFRPNTGQKMWKVHHSQHLLSPTNFFGLKWNIWQNNGVPFALIKHLMIASILALWLYMVVCLKSRNKLKWQDIYSNLKATTGDPFPVSKAYKNLCMPKKRGMFPHL